VIEGILTIIAAIALGVGFLWITDFVRIHSMHYRLDENGLAFVGVLWRPRPIPYGQIASAGVISWLDYLRLDKEVSWFKTRLYTTRSLTRKLVLVRHRDGKAFLLTPDDPEGFVDTIKRRIADAAA